MGGERLQCHGETLSLADAFATSNPERPSFGCSQGNPLSEKTFELVTNVDKTALLRTSVSYQQDRFITQLDALIDSEIIPLLRSVEGASSEVWPASGPLQEVLPQVNESGELLTAVGRAGKSHWSTVVSCTGDGGIEFDFACRVKEEPSWLGSTYAILSKPGTPAGEGRWEVDLQERDAKLVCQQAEATRMDKDGNLVRFSPVKKNHVVPRTDRWKYVFRLVVESPTVGGGGACS